MISHKICFYGEPEEIIQELSLITPPEHIICAKSGILYAHEFVFDRMPRRRKRSTQQKKPSLIFTESPVNIQTHVPTPVLCARHPPTAQTVSVSELEDLSWVNLLYLWQFYTIYWNIWFLTIPCPKINKKKKKKKKKRKFYYLPHGW